jgi:hypothetical protein
VRDHASGVLIEPLLEASQIPGPGQRALDVLIVDDQMRIFTAAQIGAVQAQGTHVIGLWDAGDAPRGGRHPGCRGRGPLCSPSGSRGDGAFGPDRNDRAGTDGSDPGHQRPSRGRTDP